MIANVSAHRRANAFAQALEEQPERGTAAEQSDVPSATAAERTEQDRMLVLATGLGELPRPALDPEVKVVQRAQLVAAMEAMLLEGTARGGADPSVPEQARRAAASAEGRPREAGGRSRGAHRASPLGKLRPRSRLSKGIAAGGLTMGVAAGAFGGVAAASSDALPGDSLYGLKRGMEDFKLGMADDASDRGNLYLDQASTRLNEARRLVERDRSGPLDHESLAEIRRALSGMQHDAAEGHRLLHEVYERDGSLSPIQTLSSFSRSHRDAWGALRDRLPVQLGDVSEQVSSVFDAIDQEVEPLRALLPQAPSEKDGSSAHPGAGSDRTGTSGTDERPEPSATSGSTDGKRDSGSPRPSSSDAGEEKGDDGLLGGNTGGLLDPPQEETSSSPSDGTTEPKQPDVTLPPLLPGLLPGLGIDSEDAD
ncbi:hypothetical protein GCM10010358_72280 [Streptomyces minutiscleroticus]|uniref:DUF5667 domain-containing protein n=1 Tax=Streptomyces minutiscleroticus TaxID=68238 RepID=A0A918NZI9_9ACTN|nr:DUF5667 domain-containing protein [Streptomyces minutiscleroticus]GGY08844.1 hypothetical protein GCM10010358_72280 [Streptomyces minutiscleroticus]